MNFTGNRKLFAVAAMLLIGIVACLLKGDVPTNFLALLEFVFGAFVAGNGVEHITNAVQARAAMPSAAPNALTLGLPDHGPILNHISEQNTATQQGIATVQQTLSFIIDKTRLNQS